MLSPFHFAGIITVIFAVYGPARAQELAPPGSDVSIHKLVIDGASYHTVKYYVKGGSPQLQALVRRVEWTENELSVVEQLQLLKLETVISERRVAAFRGAQLTNLYFPTGYGPPSNYTDHGYERASPLQRALSRQLAYEATPQAALQLIGFLELQQTQLDAELKALAPPEKKAVQGPVDALRPRLEALPRKDVPAPAVPPKAPMAEPVPQQVRQNRLEVEWNRSWWLAEVVRTKGDYHYIHYVGAANAWDEWVGLNRIRRPIDKQ